MSRAFYKPEPVEPEKSAVGKSLKWSLRISVAGWAMYGLFAFAFADLDVIPEAIQKALVLLGSACIVIGGETNTVPTLIAALSKVGTGRFRFLDALAALASLAGSLCNVLITFATRQDKLEGTPWRGFSIVKGPLVLGIASTLDFYGAILERSFIKRDYEMDWAAWWEEKQAWDERYHIAPIEPPEEGTRVEFDESWPQADIDDARQVLAHLNGERNTWDKAQLRTYLERGLAEMEKRPRNDKTVYRWLDRA